MNRFVLTSLMAILIVASGLGSAVARQGAPVDDRLASLGLPTLEITVTADAFEGLPEETPAGRYLVTTSAAEDIAADGMAFDFMQPVGISAADLVSSMSGPAEGLEEPPQASPDPADAGAPGGPPTFLFGSLFAGGVGILPGGTVSVVIDLTPGEWVIFSSEAMATQPPVLLVATGAMPANLPEPESDATMVIDEYSIDITEGELREGLTMLRVDNVGGQPHFVLALRGPDTMTQEQVGEIITGEMSGTPTDAGIDPETDLVEAFYTGTQSTGTTQWILLDLEPGTYALVCYFPDQADMMPHAYHGMYEVVTVGE